MCRICPLFCYLWSVTVPSRTDIAPNDPEVAVRIFEEILEEMARVKYYKPKDPRESQPRVSNKPINKWQQEKAKRKANA